MASHGDKRALDSEIIRVLVGSGVHGVAIEGTDDRDEMGVYIERPEQLLGLDKADGSYVSRTQPDGARSGPGDLDLNLYSLRRFMSLATQGNPSILVLLYTTGDAVLHETALGEELRAMRDRIVSFNAAHRFLGYLDGQRQRMTGEGPRKNRVPNRPELVEAHGYDTKYASHALRLGLQGVELVRTGSLSLPMPEEDRQRVLAMKRGEFTYGQSLIAIDTVRNYLAALIERPAESPLRETPDFAAINDWMIRAHQLWWSLDAAAVR